MCCGVGFGFWGWLFVGVLLFLLGFRGFGTPLVFPLFCRVLPVFGGGVVFCVLCSGWLTLFCCFCFRFWGFCCVGLFGWYPVHDPQTKNWVEY